MNETINLSIYVEAGVLKTQGGLKYLQEAIDKKIGEEDIIKITSFNTSRNNHGELSTELVINTTIPVIPFVADTVTKTFNMRKRFIKNK